MSIILITLFAAAAAVTLYSIGVCIALILTK